MSQQRPAGNARTYGVLIVCLIARSAVLGELHPQRGAEMFHRPAILEWSDGFTGNEHRTARRGMAFRCEAGVVWIEELRQRVEAHPIGAALFGNRRGAF